MIVGYQIKWQKALNSASCLTRRNLPIIIYNNNNNNNICFTSYTSSYSEGNEKLDFKHGSLQNTLQYLSFVTT